MNKKGTEIFNYFYPSDLDKHDIDYLEFHKYRYKYLLGIIKVLTEKYSVKEKLRLLDIGPAYQTFLIRETNPEISADTIGFDHPVNKNKDYEKHFTMDLNNADTIWEPENNIYDIIVFCEVLEHLYTKPEILLSRLYSSLKHGGYLVLQTPNAAALNKRLMLLSGKNPYDLLSENKMGHFREYTGNELKNILSNSGFIIEKVNYKNYFNCNKTIFHKLFRKSEFIIPSTFRDGISIIARKPK